MEGGPTKMSEIDKLNQKDREFIMFLGEYGYIEESDMGYFYRSKRYRENKYNELKNKKLIRAKKMEGYNSIQGEKEKRLLRYAERKSTDNELRRYIRKRIQSEEELLKEKEFLEKMIKKLENKREEYVLNYLQNKLKDVEIKLNKKCGEERLKVITLTTKGKRELKEKGIQTRSIRESEYRSVRRQCDITNIALKLREMGVVVTEQEYKKYDERAKKIIPKFVQSAIAKKRYSLNSTKSRMNGVLFGPGGVYFLIKVRKGVDRWEIRRETDLLMTGILRDEGEIKEISGTIMLVDEIETAKKIEEYICNDKLSIEKSIRVIPDDEVGWEMLRLIALKENYQSLIINGELEKGKYPITDLYERKEGQHIIFLDGDISKKLFIANTLPLMAIDKEKDKFMLIVSEWHKPMYEEIVQLFQEEGIKIQVEEIFQEEKE
jgi:hypothetical protein